jgi:serine/threonine protein kinase/tetratricopeptide (TPR) repeat protein
MSDHKIDLEMIFNAALQRHEPAERSAYLDGACGDDLGARERVEELIRAHELAGSFLSRETADVQPGKAGDPDFGLPPSEGPGAKIGRYKLLQLIGEGGFGTVYMAEQEEPVRRKVALKIIKLGMDTKQVIARFEAERQALAIMDHPNIAKVLDAGATPISPHGAGGGRPYFVMELVRGIALTEYCDKNNLNPRERLELFIPICKAVQHAHNKGIIHRDLKPGNVLVTLHDTVPVPKVIDFGIAKATNQRLTEKTLFTEFHQFIGTPEYMSPEQAEMSGLDVDTRSDIYSLGVLLYELMTGTTPFDSRTLREAGYIEITRIIREEEPPTPSTRLSMLGDGLADVARNRKVEPGALSRILKGDLDWIVMKTLEKDRTRRYETANALADDVMRHLRSEPVNASPPSAAYKVAKFVRRNRTMVVAASVVVAALVVGLALATLGLMQASRDRDIAEGAKAQAEAEATRSRAIVSSLQEILMSVDPDRAIALDVDAESVLSLARQVVSDASPMPVPFGKWVELDAVRAANWERLGEAAEELLPLMRDLKRLRSEGRGVDAQLQKKVQRENSHLARLAVGLIGRIPTHSPINGEYTHPLVLINLMGAVLERTTLPLTVSQKVSLVAIGVEFEARYEKRQKDYSDGTPQLRKLVDELELKRDCMARMEAVLTPEQRAVVIIPETHRSIHYGIFAPGQMVHLFIKRRNLSFKEQAKSGFPSQIAKKFELDATQRDSLSDEFDTMYEDLAPLLEQVRENDGSIHLDDTITAGLAFARLYEALLRLPDLPKKIREKLLTESAWAVPHVIRKSIEETRKAVENLRRRHGPNDERVADELEKLASILEDRERHDEAIPVVTEAIEIYRKTQGESWNSDSLRLWLRNLAWRIALEVEQTRERYELARGAAELVLSLKPQSAASLRALGAIQYRLALYDDAVETLERSDEIHRKTYEGGVPDDVGFLAMAYYRAGKTAEAKAALSRLRELMNSREHSRDSENRRVSAEAEAFFESLEPEGATRR